MPTGSRTWSSSAGRWCLAPAATWPVSGWKFSYSARTGASPATTSSSKDDHDDAAAQVHLRTPTMRENQPPGAKPGRLPGGPAAIDDEGVPGDVAGGVAGQEQQRAVELVGAGGASHRGVRVDPGDLVGVAQVAAGRGGKPGRGDGVDPYPSAGPLGGEFPGQRDHRGLAGGVA